MMDFDDAVQVIRDFIEMCESRVMVAVSEEDIEALKVILAAAEDHD